MRKCERLARGEKSRKADDEKAGDEKAGDGKAVMVKVRKRKKYSHKHKACAARLPQSVCSGAAKAAPAGLSGTPSCRVRIAAMACAEPIEVFQAGA
jgi:ABC-type uncharacterized transport system YnjBCD ATPase subunit